MNASAQVGDPSQVETPEHVACEPHVTEPGHVRTFWHVSETHDGLLQVGCGPHVAVRSQVVLPWHVIAPTTHVFAPAQVTLPAHVCPLLHVADPTQLMNPAHVLKFGQVLPPHVPAGAHVAAPAHVPKTRHEGFGAHEATPAQVGFPGMVAGTQRIAQLAAAIVGVGGQFISPGQLGDPSQVTQLAARQLSNPGKVGGGGTSSQFTASHELKFDHVIQAGPLSQLTEPSIVMHDPDGQV